MCALSKSATDLTLPSSFQSSSSSLSPLHYCLHWYHCHNDVDHADEDESLPNSGESHKSPPEGVKERPGAGRVVLTNQLFPIFHQLDWDEYAGLSFGILIINLTSPSERWLCWLSWHKNERLLREGFRKKKPYFLWSFAKPPLGPPPTEG